MAISIAFKGKALFEFIGDLFHQFAGNGRFGQPVPAVHTVLADDMHLVALAPHRVGGNIVRDDPVAPLRSEEHTSELQSLMRISYAVFCLKKKTQRTNKGKTTQQQI